MEAIELNPALNDIAEIIQRPELTQEEWDIVSKASDWIKATLKPEVRAELQAENKIELARFKEELDVLNKTRVTEYMEKWRESQEPLSHDELSTLLTQEYLEFPVKIRVRGEESIRNFTLYELPNSVEEKFLKVLQTNLVPMMRELAAADWHIEGSIVDQINGWITTCPTISAVAAEVVAICLDPLGLDSVITKEWVRTNQSTYRIASIIATQAEANRYRDFFSKGSRLYRSLTGK